jgi:hypothetical protein
MSYSKPSQDTGSTEHCGCTANDLPWDTQTKTINKFRDDYCKEMYVLMGETRQLEIRRKKLVDLTGKKNCWVVWTERNYQIHRNLELLMGTELAQTNDSIKESVKVYQNSNKALADALKKLVGTVKDIRNKTKEFRDAACKLEACKEDACNCSQIYELTGEKPEGGCNGNTSHTGDRKPPCSHDDIRKLIEDLICMPKKGLYPDIDAISKSATNVQGIQTFSNIGTLEPLQSELAIRIKKLGTQITDVIKKNEGELKLVLEDLTKSKKEQAKTDVELYAKRSDFEGVKKAVAYFCCLPCSCVADEKGNCDKRLDVCEKDICKICQEVQKASCEPEPAKPGQTPTTPC